ncbi:DUF2510 domain-containing protein [Actinoplanes sp. TBRC 11911]|uniref:DUF2510 domain-containing protein n=1 Tax=Actinoplanes sp. TBRC 11911 TaxID=2729386 RepID=UPI00145F1262|nr:DUF2510 domain-containing protein [Actinoplanes sp. TBRC 11911]NMO53674.1 DUF2510 domain-containing protein [Actinoplanes sp. TBRC 11911]
MSQNSATPFTATPAGWYADPSGQPAQRWWDGQAWTAHVQPTPPAPVSAQQFYGQTADPAYGQPAAVVQPSAPGYGVGYPGQPQPGGGLYNAAADVPGGKNMPARNALILGIISLIINPLCLPAIGAIVYGILGIKRAGVLTEAGFGSAGKGKAITGLVLGSVGLVATVILKGFFF